MRQSKGPGIVERLWRNKWNLVRHFILAGSAAAITAYTTSKSWTATGGAFLIGGMAGLVRKGGDDELRAAGKSDILTAAAKVVGAIKLQKGGDAMSIRTNVYEVSTELKGLGMVFVDDEPDKEQLDDILGRVLGIVKEGSDFKDIPKEERFKAIAHAFAKAGAELMDAAVEYSDEKPAESTVPTT